MNDPIPKEESKVLEQLQLFTTFGYLVFLFIGISKEVLKYWVLEINIIPYLNLIDLMLGPIEVIRQDFLIVMIPFVLILIADGLHTWGTKMRDNKKEHKGSLKKMIDWCADLTFNWLLIGLGYASFVLGITVQGAIADADDLKEALETNTVIMTHQLTFQDKEKLEVAVVDQTSEFIFYVVKEEHQISISPINGIIKRWVALDTTTTQ